MDKSKKLTKKSQYDIKVYYHPYFCQYFYNIQEAYKKIDTLLSNNVFGYIVVNDNITLMLKTCRNHNSNHHQPAQERELSREPEQSSSFMSEGLGLFDPPSDSGTDIDDFEDEHMARNLKPKKKQRGKRI